MKSKRIPHDCFHSKRLCANRPHVNDIRLGGLYREESGQSVTAAKAGGHFAVSVREQPISCLSHSAVLPQNMGGSTMHSIVTGHA